MSSLKLGTVLLVEKKCYIAFRAGRTAFMYETAKKKIGNRKNFHPKPFAFLRSSQRTPLLDFSGRMLVFLDGSIFWEPLR
jgi:hypothetical protein